MHRLDLGLYSRAKEFWGGMESEPLLNSKGEIPSTGGSQHDQISAVSLRTASPIHYQLSYSDPPNNVELIGKKRVLKNHLDLDKIVVI